MTSRKVVEAPELKPCPFCGGEDLMAFPPTCHVSTPYNSEDRMYPFVRCMRCLAEAPGDDNSGRSDDRSVSSAITAWNTRADQPTGWRVKPLGFSTRSERLPDGATLAADCPFGRYFICPRGEYGFGWKRPGSYVFMGFESDENTAKAAAQADYERRLSEAAEPCPITTAQAAKVLLDEFTTMPDTFMVDSSIAKAMREVKLKNCPPAELQAALVAIAGGEDDPS